jgi:hypothetical protein
MARMVIVFAGPPLSGKTKLCKRLSEKRALVIVDATYGLPEHGAALVELARSLQVGTCLIECRASPNDSAQRLRERKTSHALALQPGPHIRQSTGLYRPSRSNPSSTAAST